MRKNTGCRRVSDKKLGLPGHGISYRRPLILKGRRTKKCMLGNYINLRNKRGFSLCLRRTGGNKQFELKFLLSRMRLPDRNRPS